MNTKIKQTLKLLLVVTLLVSLTGGKSTQSSPLNSQ